MRQLISLLMLLAVAGVIHMLAIRTDMPVAEPVRAGMSVGLLMLGAWLAGNLCDRIALPKISGYLLYGVLVGPSLMRIISGGQVEALVPADQVLTIGDQTPSLQFATNLAVALIALTAGGEIRLDWLARQIGRIAGLTLVKMIGVWLIVAGAAFLVSPYIPVIGEAPVMARLVIAMLVGLIAAANSPAVVIAMISEFEARGPLARTALAVTICKDMVMVMLFAAALAISRGMLDENTAISADFMLAVGVQLVGSLVAGALAGWIMALYVHRVQAHLPIFLVGCCLLIALIAEQHFVVAGQDVHLEALLTALAAGLVMRNVWSEEAEPLFETIESLSVPVYCLFFAVTGARVDLAVLAEMWLFVPLLCAVRVVAVWGMVFLGGRMLRLEPEWRDKLWLAFIPQAGVALALAALVDKAFTSAPWASQVQSLMLGMIAVHAIIGPVGFRWALIRSGEAKQVAESNGPAPTGAAGAST
jgi:Kef-type K+ transport system membrane component KefB